MKPTRKYLACVFDKNTQKMFSPIYEIEAPIYGDSDIIFGSAYNPHAVLQRLEEVSGIKVYGTGNLCLDCVMLDKEEI